MNTKINLKKYQGKDRIYLAVPRAPRISRLWIWDSKKSEYRIPPNGKCYFARRYEKNSHWRVYRFFESVDEARCWQADGKEIQVDPGAPERLKRSAPLFEDIVKEWRERRYPSLAIGTQVQYDKLIRLHLRSLFDSTMHEITPQRIDRWLDELKNPKGVAMMRSSRRYFDHELTILVTILRYYQEYHDDSEFRFPIKQRHRDAIRLNRPVSVVPKDLSEDEFHLFKLELQKLKHGPMLSVLATVQYFQALRISEAAGLYWEDIHFDWKVPQDSRIKVVRSVCFPHKTGMASFIKGGFKNAAANNGIKEQPMFPETFEALKSVYFDGTKGLVFNVDGKHFEYRVIQAHYDRAFKAAGLPYRGTHVMRHGGCRRIYNHTPDPAVAQQLLGNADLKTTLIYAKRHASALTEVARGFWEKKMA